MAMLPQDFFTYPISFLNIAAGAQSTQQMQFDASSDFYWFYSAYDAENAAAVTNITSATRIYPRASILITPTDTSSQFMQAAVPITSLFGNGENPFVMPVPRKIPARSVLTFQFTNRDTALAYNVFLSLIGKKQYLGGQ